MYCEQDNLRAQISAAVTGDLLPPVQVENDEPKPRYSREESTIVMWDRSTAGKKTPSQYAIGRTVKD